MGITVQEGQKQKAIRRAIDIGLAILLVIIAIIAMKLIKRDFKKIDQETKRDDSIAMSDNDSNIQGDQDIFVSEAIDNDKVHQGPLILVNGGAEYKWNEDGLKSLLELRNNDGTDCYTVMDNDVMARAEAAAAMNAMLKAFNKATGHTDIRIESAYRSVAEQQEIYDNAEDKANASEPGFSDYHTGYSIELNVVNDDGESLDFDGTGDFEWLIKNCYKYGFILRFPEGKDSMTGQSYRPWHFRYVGPVHASYMFENGLCLEEYIKKLETYPYDGNHLNIVDASGKRFEVYYAAADMASTLTSVAVPSGSDYELSGNNTNGFIITINLDGPSDLANMTEAVQANTKPSESAESEAEDSEDSEEESDDDSDEDSEEEE